MVVKMHVRTGVAREANLTQQLVPIDGIAGFNGHGARLEVREETVFTILVIDHHMVAQDRSHRARRRTWDQPAAIEAVVGDVVRG